MLVVHTTANRFEDQTVIETHGEHLIERVTALENQMSRILTQLERMVDLMLKQANAANVDHVLLDAMVTTLAEAGTLDIVTMRRRWQEQLKDDADNDFNTESVSWNQSASLRKLLTAPLEDTKPQATLEEILAEGTAAAESGDVEAAINAMEKAAARAPFNSGLSAFLGSHFFRENDLTRGEMYLVRAHQHDGATPLTHLLLGVLHLEAKRFDAAEGSLRSSANHPLTEFAAKCALGLLHAQRENWSASAVNFKAALKLKERLEVRDALAFVSKKLKRAVKIAKDANAVEAKLSLDKIASDEAASDESFAFEKLTNAVREEAVAAIASFPNAQASE